MVVRETPDGLVCVRQVDHAALAGLLGDHWGGPSFPVWMPAESVRFSVRRHDAGWVERDADPSVDPDGGILDYRSIPLEDRLDVAERSVARVAAVDPYAGWLVSRHFASFLEGFGEPDAVGWIVDQVGRRAGMLARARARVGREALHPYALEANLDWLQLLDALSLALIEDWERWESRPIAAGYGEETIVFVYERAGSSEASVEATLEPWPFGSDRIAGAAPGARLSGRSWESDAALREAWADAGPADVEFVLSPG